MQRVIYSLYIDIPVKEHYGDSKIKFDTTEKASVTVNAFKKHYDKLVNTKITYAEYCELFLHVYSPNSTFTMEVFSFKF